MAKAVDYINTAVVGDFERGYYVSKVDAIIAVEIERKEMIDKACKWLIENAKSHEYLFDNERMIKHFKKAMEGVK